MKQATVSKLQALWLKERSQRLSPVPFSSCLEALLCRRNDIVQNLSHKDFADPRSLVEPWSEHQHQYCREFNIRCTCQLWLEFSAFFSKLIPSLSLDSSGL